VAAIAGRSSRREALAAPVLAAMKGASIPARCTLLRAAGRVGGADALKALRAALADDNAAVRDAAVRTMAGVAGVEAAPDLLALAREAPEPTHRVLAMRGYWRVVALAGGRSAVERLRMCQAGLATARRVEETRLGLAALANVPHLEALKLAETFCQKAAVRSEAEAACVRIAASVASAQPAKAKATLLRIRETSRSPANRSEAGRALAEVQKNAGYVADWLVAGPYRQAGKQCGQLYDIAFPPEKPGAAGIAWKPAPHPADASLRWQVDGDRHG
jgi:hypothetical protein